MSGVVRAALIGVPLPVCSCGVVPLTIELRRKGASRPASLSFLITTPESSIDSILLTWGLMGPVFAVARPVAAFFTAIIGGIAAIASPETRMRKAVAEELPEAAPTCDDGCQPHPPVSPEGAAARQAVRRFLRRSPKGAGVDGEAGRPGLWRNVLRPALRYGFVDLLDDLAFWLVLGVGAAGFLAAVLPDDLAARGLGGGIVPMLFVLVVAIPLYMCASASTPVAAALLAKGVSPGAALVFLLAGPATNAATILLLGRTFGRRFVQIYLGSVAVGAILSGLALEAFVGTVGVSVTAVAADGYTPVEWAAFVVLFVLLAWRLWRGAARQGWRELREATEGLGDVLAGGGDETVRRRRIRRAVAIVAGLLVAIYLLTGCQTVPADSQGYGFVFGQLVRQDQPPGLHYLPPAPVGRWEVRRTLYPRKADVGFRTDLDLLARRRELIRRADPNGWHSPVAAMNADPAKVSYLTADENLVELSFTVHYTLDEPAEFFYAIDQQVDFVVLYAEAAAREFIAGNRLEVLMTTGRQEIEAGVLERLKTDLDALESGVEVVSVHVMDIHPPAEVVFSFRDVSSAREDKETRIYRAREVLAKDVPQARGEGEKILAQATAAARAEETIAGGQATSFIARAEAIRPYRDVLIDLLWRESAERSLAGREKFIVPPDTAGIGVGLWRDDIGGVPEDGGD
jgi:hypothetical protein